MTHGKMNDILKFKYIIIIIIIIIMTLKEAKMNKNHD